MMHRGQTRDFGKRKKAILSHTVDVTARAKPVCAGTSCRNDKDRGWTLKKEEYLLTRRRPPLDGQYRDDRLGQHLPGVQHLERNTHPSIGITGRKGTSNHMNIRKWWPFDGNVRERSAAYGRWGDYSAMSIDPVDDTCWYTQEYAKPSSIWPIWRPWRVFGWATQIIQYDVN